MLHISFTRRRCEVLKRCYYTELCDRVPDTHDDDEEDSHDLGWDCYPNE